MTNFQINYTHPWLLLLIPLAVICTLVPYFRMNKRYRCTRNRIVSMVLHLLAMVLGINLLAGLSFSYEIPNEGNELILLVDVSDSGTTTRDQKDEFIQTVLGLCEDDCKIGIVKFGFDQKYVAEFSQDAKELYENYLGSEDPDTTATDLASAMKYASKLFTNPETGKIVVLSDGIETDSAAMSVIKGIAAQGIKVDTLCYPNPDTDEVQIMSVNLQDQQIVAGKSVVFDITMRHNLGKGDQTLELELYGNDELVGSTRITMTKAEQTFPISLVLEDKGLHELRFEIKAGRDSEVKNNTYHTFVNLQKFENILLIENQEGESAKLQTMLKDNYKVTSISIEEDLAEIPRDITDLADYEQVILVNVAYQDMPAGFEEMLHKYVKELGGGLLTVGGINDQINGQLVPHMYNRADMELSTYYKDMLPVNVIDYTPPIAIMLVIDESGSMSMGKLPAAKQGAEACLDALNDRDYCGVTSFSDASKEELEVLPVSDREMIRDAIREVGKSSEGSGGTIYSDALRRAGNALAVIDNVERKHIIIVTDGDPSDREEFLDFVTDNLEKGITMSIVTVGDDLKNKEWMDMAAEMGGGKHYHIPNNQLENIPTIMQQDLEMEAVAEIKYGEEFVPRIYDTSIVTEGITQDQMPVLTGYYGTVAKKDATVPLMGQYTPIYAQWKYGEGTVGSFMCDLNGDWSAQFIENEVGQTIVRNIVDNLFPMEDVRADKLQYQLKVDNYTSQLNVHGVSEGNRVQVLVEPITESVKEVLKDPISIIEAEDNRRFTFVVKNPGVYQITLQQVDEAGNVVSEIVTYHTYGYSQEYNAFPERLPLGAELLELLAVDGKGVVIEDPAQVFASFAKTLKRGFDPRILFLILVIVFVLLDIAVRKFKFKWPHELVREYKQKKADQVSK